MEAHKGLLRSGIDPHGKLWATERIAQGLATIPMTASSVKQPFLMTAP